MVGRLARPDECEQWDHLVGEQHYLGFKQFAGRGLRYIPERHGHWLALRVSQTGVFQCIPRDHWIGRHWAILFLIANYERNALFLVMCAIQILSPCLGSAKI